MSFVEFEATDHITQVFVFFLSTLILRKVALKDTEESWNS